jgi:hypothetical protein
MYKIWTTTRPLGVNYKIFTNKYVIFRFKNKIWKVGMLLKILGCINFFNNKNTSLTIHINTTLVMSKFKNGMSIRIS